LQPCFDDQARLVQSYAEGDPDLAADFVHNDHMNVPNTPERVLRDMPNATAA
jgi:hypothetical protein